MLDLIRKIDLFGAFGNKNKRQTKFEIMESVTKKRQILQDWAQWIKFKTENQTPQLTVFAIFLLNFYFWVTQIFSNFKIATQFWTFLISKTIMAPLQNAVQANLNLKVTPNCLSWIEQSLIQGTNKNKRYLLKVRQKQNEFF